MILADTSVWIDHLRSGETLTKHLREDRVAMHLAIVGELSMGTIRNRQEVVHRMLRLTRVVAASDAEVRRLVETERLYGRGIGYVDAQLLASVRLTPGVRLWTFDRRLSQAALDLGVSASRISPPPRSPR